MSEQFIDSSPTTQKSSFPEKRLALLVGVNDTPGSDLEHLDGAEQDAQDMAEVLQKYCGFEIFSAQPLLGPNADSQSVRSAIYSLVDNLQQDDFLLFYFSGHGLLAKSAAGRNDDSVYLATSNFSRRETLIDQHSHISLQWLRQMLFDRCYAGKVLIILDCCYSGNIGEHGYDVEREDLIERLKRFFNLNQSTAVNPHGLHLTLSATTYDKVAYEVLGRGPLAFYLIPALSGEADEAIDSKNRVNFHSLYQFLHDSLHDSLPSFSGGDAGQDCILAYHSKHPLPYFPYAHDPLFRTPPETFAHLETALRGEHARLGLFGMGGVGKSLLARELAISTQSHFTDGLFWAPATLDEHTIDILAHSNPLIHALAILAEKTRYLPPNEDPVYPNEDQRARHLCRFLAQLPHALLLLDNLEDPNLIQTTLPDLAGQNLQCTILYTSRAPFRPSTYTIHHLTPLNHEQDLLYLLLHDVRPDVLTLAENQQSSPELIAAHAICQRTGGLPLALILLRRQLEQNSWLTLTELDLELREQGVLAIAQDEQHIQKSLSSCFTLSWQRIAQSAEHNLARQMFLLASYFPQAEPIPLWLLALACTQPEQFRLGSPLLKARQTLLDLGLIEDITRDTIQMHSLLRDFGQELAQQSTLQPLLQEAAEQIISTFEQVQSLAERASKSDFWSCLTQIRTARAYLAALQPALAPRLQRIEHRLDRETFFLGTSGLWPDQLPGLFYQQMHNRLLEEQLPLPPPPPAGTRWLQQLVRVGTEDDQIIRVYSGHSGGVTSVAFSPDGTKVLTGSEDTTARLFDTATGQTLHILTGHNKVIDSVAYSPDGSYILTGSRDHTARLWNAETGECIRILKDHTNWVNAVAFSPDGTFLLTGSQDGTAHIYETLTGTIHASFSTNIAPLYQYDLFGGRTELEPTNGAYAITAVAFSPDTLHVALGCGTGRLLLWHTLDHTYTSIRLRDHVSISSLSYTSDASKLLIGAGYSISLWDDTQQSLSLAPRFSHQGDISSFAFSHDATNTFFASGSWDGTFRLWKTTNYENPLFTSNKHAGTINGVAFSPDDSTLLIGSSDTTAKLLQVPFPLSELSSTNLATLSLSTSTTLATQTKKSLFNASFSPDGSFLLATYNDFTNVVCSVVPHIQKLPLAFQSGLLSTTFGKHYIETQFFSSGDTSILIQYTGANLHLWDIYKGQNTRTQKLQGEKGPIFEPAFSLDGKYILAGSSYDEAALWDTSSGRILKTLRGHSDIVLTTALSPDATHLLTGSRDRTARLWKRSGRNYLPTVLSGHGGPVTKVAFSPDGSKAFTGSTDTLLRIWSAETGELLATLDGKCGPIHFIACSPNNQFVLTGDMFNQIRIWQIATPSPLLAAYTTQAKLLAAHWQDDSLIYLVDDIMVDMLPRIYKLRLLEH